MPINVCIAGATGWAGSLIARRLLEGSGASAEFKLTGAIARQKAGLDIGEVLGLPPAGLAIVPSLGEALTQPIDVLIDFTAPDSVKARTLEALDHGLRVVIGTSGLTASDFTAIERKALALQLGVAAAGNFSITAALAKHFSLLAARYLPSWELIDYASANKVDAPSGTVRELAEALGAVAPNQVAIPIEQTIGAREARGSAIEGTQVHAVRLPGFTLAFEAHFGLPDERLMIRHEAGTSAAPYVEGTLLAVQKVMHVVGLIRGMDRLLFDDA
jgi:4-hydroxy-tetrahydrodipicolinate reductase